MSVAVDPSVVAVDDDLVTPQLQGAFAVLRRGLVESPELRAGALFTIMFGLVGAAGALLVPILVQQILDRGLNASGSFRPAFVYTACGLAAAVIVIVYLAARTAYMRLIRASESALKSLRVKTFDHIHRLSIAEQTEQRRGAFTARVTADVDTLAEFMQWGAMSWIISTTLIAAALVVMAVYSWQLTLVVLFAVAPLFFVLRKLQRGLLAAYDLVRNRVSDTLSEISESVMGADVVRAYGLTERTDRRLKRAIRKQYDAQMIAARYQSTIFPVGDVFGAVAVAAVLAVGVALGPGWGLSAGRLVAFLFLTNLLLQPVAEISETFDQTQTAIAGWRKVLSVMDIPIEVAEPVEGVVLPREALSVKAEGVKFGYRDGGVVLRGIDVDIAPGAHVAIVGETGCGKTTFAKLLSRLADPTEGRISIGGVDVRDIDPESRRTTIRMVPQDGFLFDATIEENVRFGRPGATRGDAADAFAALGLEEWLDRMPEGLDTRVGQRGDNLSFGECQLVALARAHIAQPGVLILDEATSAVDPETERALSSALERLSEGRTTITIAHRLSTAESAEFIYVFDRGLIVESGVHAALIEAGGVYASLYASWLGNTRTDLRGWDAS